MPVILFTTAEVAHSLAQEQRKLSLEIMEFSDLKLKPLDPGESVAARHHRLAKLGKRLAEAWAKFDAVMQNLVPEDVAESEPSVATPTPDNSQAN